MKDKGFRTTYKFSYNYNMTSQMHDRIVRDGWCLKYFHAIASHQNLPRNEVIHNKQFEQSILNAMLITCRYAEYIWANNPTAYDYTNLTKVATLSDWYHILNFVIGAGYEFHPLDIKYHEKVFVDDNHRYRDRYTEQIEFKSWCKEEHDIDTGCLILSPQNMEKLKEILTCQDTPHTVQIAQRLAKESAGLSL